MPIKHGGALIRRFRRGLFEITVTAFDDKDYDPYTTGLDDEIRDKIEDGTFTVFRVEATLWLLGRELATEHLGGCICESPCDFMDHIGLRQAERDHLAQTGHAVSIGSYFSDMVRAVIEEGRKEAIKLLPQLHGIRLRGAPQPAPLLPMLERLRKIGVDGVVERRRTGEPMWSALDEVKAVAEAAITTVKEGQL